MDYFEFIQINAERLIDGTIITILQFFTSSIVAITIAFVTGLLLLSRITVLRFTTICYVEIFRGTSLLVQLFWFFYALPVFGISLDKFTAGFLAIGLNVGAYGAHVVKSAIMSVPKGQWEACIALNLTPSQRMIRIILPQAIIIMLPIWGNLLIELLKATALVALISVADLMFETRMINNMTFQSVQAFGTALVVYYILARFCVTPVMTAVERVMGKRIGRAKI